MDDDIPIFVKLTTDVNQCDCCGKTNLKRTVEIDLAGGTINLGVTCAGKWFALNMSGNPYYAARKLDRKLRTMSNDDIEEIISDIQESNENL